MANLVATITLDVDKDMLEKCGLGWKIVSGKIDTDNGNYRTGGFALDLSSQLPKKVAIVLIEPKSGYIFQYDYTEKKVLMYYADYSQSSDGVLIVLPDNSVAINVDDIRFIAIGY